MSYTHPIPLQVAQGDGYREATAEEYAAYEHKAGPGHTRWKTANRIALAKKLMTEGQEHAIAWTKAFKQYPEVPNKTTKPRFLFK